ncbi:MAG: hypothetical protein AMJ61_16545 [Desulfobacterales bacterium SG8_35_2]|nr:MAG: hypothetical protein AMJ61_16545 [Desulfobacterales bacterium SG8_35_2]
MQADNRRAADLDRIVHWPEDSTMTCSISRVEYFHTTIKDRPGEAYKFLSQLALLRINLLAFNAAPINPTDTKITIFPENPKFMKNEASRAGLYLEGPHPALLVQCDDRLGALADIHLHIYEANVNVESASGVTDGRGAFGYVIHVKKEDFEKAAEALGI